MPAAGQLARALRLVPALALMALGWKLSATPDLSSGLPGWDTLLRKGAHLTEFALLWLAWWWALGGADRPQRARPILVAATITLAWAALDEVHQTWVEGRHGSPVDWCIDAAGCGAAIGLTLWWRSRLAAVDAAAELR